MSSYSDKFMAYDKKPDFVIEEKRMCENRASN